MALYVIGELTSRYATDARVRGIVDAREIWIVPNVNPDGSEYDIADGRYRSWRKNRQPNPGSEFTGTDLNRNWGYRWGCCGGSSGAFALETYRGPSAFSAPETRALRDFVFSRVIGGVQQIKTSIDFHAYSELILWPYGHTRADTTVQPDARRPRHVRRARHEHGAHATATPPSSRAISTSPTARSTTGCGATRRSSPSRSRCTPMAAACRASTRATS